MFTRILALLILTNCTLNAMQSKDYNDIFNDQSNNTSNNYPSMHNIQNGNSQIFNNMPEKTIKV